MFELFSEQKNKDDGHVKVIDYKNDSIQTIYDNLAKIEKKASALAYKMFLLNIILNLLKFFFFLSCSVLRWILKKNLPFLFRIL